MRVKSERQIYPRRLKLMDHSGRVRCINQAVNEFALAREVRLFDMGAYVEAIKRGRTALRRHSCRISTQTFSLQHNPNGEEEFRL